MVRLCCNLATEKERSEYSTKLSVAQQSSEDSIKAQADAAKKDKKKNTEAPPPTAETLAFEALQKEGILNANTLARALTFRLSWTDAGYGFIFDGLTSGYTTEVVVCGAMALAMPHAVVVRICIGKGAEITTSSSGDDAGLGVGTGDHEHKYRNRLQDVFVTKAKELDRLVKSLQNRPPVPTNTKGVYYPLSATPSLYYTLNVY